MTYELAKQLKDAGFPQPDSIEMGHGFYVPYPETEKWIDGESRKPYAPTLSELIEACGGRFEMLVGNYVEKGWGAIANTDEDGNKEKWGGPTPEEAVAHLWLALHNA